MTLIRIGKSELMFRVQVWTFAYYVYCHFGKSRRKDRFLFETNLLMFHLLKVDQNDVFLM